MAGFTIRNKKPEIVDQAALKRVGEQVRKRLAANKAIYRLPTDKAEIFAMGEFMSADECGKMMAMIDQVAAEQFAREAGRIARADHRASASAISRRVLATP